MGEDDWDNVGSKEHYLLVRFSVPLEIFLLKTSLR